MLKEFINKQIIKRRLLKLYYIYEKERKGVLYGRYNSNTYNELEKIKFAIAYILYVYFNCRDFNVVWDYENHISDKHMEEYLHQLCKTSNKEEFIDGGAYYYNGEKFIRMM